MKNYTTNKSLLRINYISNNGINDQSGGVSSVNYNVFNIFNAELDCVDFQYINPTVCFVENLYSKVLKILKLKRNYYFFSEWRLSKISRLYKNNKADFDFFIGFTSWLKITPNRPYFCYNDCSFITYLQYYNDRSQFKIADINRIVELEKQWLKNAKGVFFKSNWALNETMKFYGLDGGNFYNVGVAGGVDIPESDTYHGELNLLFISKEFRAKGGMQAFEVFERVRITHPAVRLNIIGETPPGDVLNQMGVTYHGFLNKSNENDLALLKQIFAQTFMLVHPTTKDTNPLVITELAYFGCPTISVDKFAISEFVIDGFNGFLVDNPNDVDTMVDVVINCILDPVEYFKIRKNAREYSTSKFTWPKIVDKILVEINA